MSKNDSVLISKDEWLRKRGHIITGGNTFNELWEEYEKQNEMLLRMQDSLIEPPGAKVAPSAVSKVDYDRGLKCEFFGKKTAGMEQDELIAFIGAMDAHITYGLDNIVHPPVIMTPAAQAILNKAIELLDACSEELFISGNDYPGELETNVDNFLKECNPNGCTEDCVKCDNCPDSLKPQAL